MLRQFKIMLLVSLAVTTECQVNFPSTRSNPSSSDENYEGCTASNGQRGLCYEFRSTKFKECSFFPSKDTSNPTVADHLTKNTCKNDGFEVFFCCPSSSASLLDGVIPKEDKCGVSFRNNVVGGTLTKEGDWPWLASIGFINASGYQHFCGGTLITNQHVLSAAHCFTPNIKREYPPSQFKFFVRLGEYDTNEDNDRAQDFDIEVELMHDYNRATAENDIILLKLNRPVTLNTDSISPACLPYHLRDENFDGENLKVVGWGRFDNDRVQGSPVPLEADVEVIPIPRCQELKHSGFSTRRINNKQICAGTGAGGRDSCNGDSGGPLNYQDPEKARFYVVGVVSFGPRTCGIKNNPGVYARVGYYIDWIEENLKTLL